jgi:hypothetical protein
MKRSHRARVARSSRLAGEGWVEEPTQNQRPARPGTYTIGDDPDVMPGLAPGARAAGRKGAGLPRRERESAQLRGRPSCRPFLRRKNM